MCQSYRIPFFGTLLLNLIVIFLTQVVEDARRLAAEVANNLAVLGTQKKKSDCGNLIITVNDIYDDIYMQWMLFISLLSNFDI